MGDDEALDTPASTLEELLSIDLLSATLESLSARDLGAASCACQRWAETLAHPAAWKQVGRAEGLVWAETEAEAEARAAAQGGWKQMFRKERTLEKRWVHYGLQSRVIAQGHDHWVPSILMEPHSRQLVTCSYDGTIRFWSDVDVAEPHCFKILHGAEGEGFSSIAMSSRAPYDGTYQGTHERATAPRLAAGSELGSVHVWEVWCPEDADEAHAAAAEARATAALGEWPTTELALAPLHLTAGGGGDGGEEYGDGPPAHMAHMALAMDQAEDGNERPLSQVLLARARPRFARKLECWTGSHDFVQSILMLPDGRTVASGGDSGNVTLHQVGDPGQPSRATPSVRLVGHQSAVMCLGATASADVLSGSVDHSVRLWDVHLGACKREFMGHTRSVHCLGLGQASPHGSTMLFTGSRDHEIKIWDMRSQGCEHTLRGHAGSVTCIGAEGWRLLSGGGYNRGSDDDEVLSVDATLRLWDLRMLGGARSPCLWTKAAPSPDDEPGTDGAPMGPFNPTHGDPVLSLQLLQDKVLTSHGGKRWTARIWDLETGPEANTAEQQGG